MRTRFPILVLPIALLVTAFAANRGLAQETVGSIGALGVTMGASFVYQGQLNRNGSPVTNLCNFRFSLWDAASNGTQLGTNNTVSTSVTNGLFTVEVNSGFQFGSSPFNGEARWLQISVQCLGDADLTPLGRQPVTATPYALGFRPGARIEGIGTVLSLITNSSSGFGLYAENSYSGSSTVASGVYGFTASPDSFGVKGSGPGVGVRGDGTTAGVYGSGSAAGVYGSGSNAGVVGETAGIGASGVYGLNTHTGSGYGVYGKGFRGLQGETSSPGGVGGFFLNKDTTGGATSVGMWVGSYVGDIIQGHEIDSVGTSMGRRFRVTYDGEVYATKNFHSGGADFAEMLPAGDGLEAGDVLVVDSRGRLARSREAYASTVVGIYSAEPGFIGGSDSDADSAGKVPLAIVGIVPVKASTENGPIHPGDLLVASSTPGHAMRASSNAPAGTMIGKALSSLESGTGTVRMLVNVQ